MNTFTFFGLLVCAILAMVGAAPEPSIPEPIPVAAADSIPVDDVLEGAESRGYGYNRGGYGHHHHHHHHQHHGYYGHGR
ncbi:hypothetical protein HF086_008946 [Spodoptera exigua]|uniref:Uncharacterized protein n=1 Tax=Spodoptera exigua TaxID=7107 RepID=A0A922MSP6_SPOEX|nr:hypothetical protein HF086_008946 [Spodoptera exigua]